MREVVLLVEGHGEVSAVPELFRRVARQQQLYELQPAAHPIRCGGIPRLLKAGELERFAELGFRRPGIHSLLLLADWEDGCALDALKQLNPRLESLAKRHGKPAAICLLVREFEALFLCSLTSIGHRHSVAKEALEPPPSPETIRDAKGLLARSLGKSYRPTRDQTPFVHALDLDRLHQASRSFRHFENVVRWLAGNPAQGSVYGV